MTKKPKETDKQKRLRARNIAVFCALVGAVVLIYLVTIVKIQDHTPPMKPNKNTMVLFGCAALIGLMIGIVSQAEPIYRMFCGATGFGGTTQNAASAPAQTKDRTITINFDSNVDPALPWEFKPASKPMTVKMGEEVTANFRVRNLSRQTSVGTAVHNVQPDKAGLYFNKTQCFCFTKQTLKPGQSEIMPVKFFIDPAMASDKNEDDVTHITLSYTFYPAKK